MNDRTKSRIALALAASLISLALAVSASTLILTERASSTSPDPLGTYEEAVKDDGFESIDWDYWLSVNPDIIGWINVPGTGIDYPIAQGNSGDPGYYLHHNASKRLDYHGAPYLTWECAEGGLLHSPNALVFGHHLQDGTMFSKLSDFIDVAYLDEHTPIQIQTPTEKANLTVLAVDRVNANRETVRIEFDTASDHATWLACVTAASDNNLSSAGFDFGSVENVVTLCTCSYSTWGNERTLLYCTIEMVP